MTRRFVTPRRLLLAASALAVAVAGIAVVGPAEAAAAPRPVYAPAGSAADPGIVLANGDFVAYTTGTLAPAASGDQASGPWRSTGPALTRLGAWSAGGAVWAPDAVKTATGWVLYYSAPAKGMDGQRCIGVATATSATGDFVPSDTPLVCPNADLGADDLVPGRPVAAAGVIDPSPFQASDGRRYLLYKTQKTPSSLRMVPLRDDATRATGTSRELVRNTGIIENPVMVQRGNQYILFASRYGYDNCSYATVWHRSTSRWDFAGKTSHTLTTTASTGICGPGGADITPALDGGTRMFLHGWICTFADGDRPCTNESLKDRPHRRAMYVAVLNWGTDGATPNVAKFLGPGQ